MRTKYCLDLNFFLIIYWDVYLDKASPDLYEQLKQQVTNSSEVMHDIFNKIERPEWVKTWIEEPGLKKVDPTKNDGVNREFNRLTTIYHPNLGPKGVSKNDLMLIAYCKVNDLILVSFEAYQANEPEKLHNYKTPRICDAEGVSWIRPIDYFEKLRISAD